MEDRLLSPPADSACGHEVQVASDRGFVDAERPGECSGIPDLGVVVGDHAPEAPQRHGRDRDAPLRNVALKEGLEELAAPRDGIRLPACGEGQGEPSANPMPCLGRGAEVGQAEALERDRLQSSGQGFGGLSQELGSSASENEEPRCQRLSVGQYAQQGEEVGAALDLVNDDQTLEGAQGDVRFGQPGETLRILKVEVVERIDVDELAGDGRLPALTRPQQRHDPDSSISALGLCDHDAMGGTAEERP